MILCAGFGERLRPLTEELPKPLVPVGDRAVLAHICAQLARAGYAAALANTHWMPEKFQGVIDAYRLDLTLVREVEIRGVAGGVGSARSRLAPPVVVWNGDILIDDPPITELVQSVGQRGGICLAVSPSEGPGTVGLDAGGRMVRVRGQSFGEEARQADYVGLFALGSSALAELPLQGDLFADYCLPLLRVGGVVDTVRVTSSWREVGSISGYLDANAHWLSHHANHASGSFVHPSATVAPGVRLSSSVIGAHARVEGVGTVERCVLWPGATAQAPLLDAVVTPRALAYR